MAAHCRWFQDSRLDSPSFGPNGIRVSPDDSKVFFSETIDVNFQAYVYTLPLEAHPQAADLHVFHQYSAGEFPDGIAFGKSDNLYVALAAPFNSGISILNSSGAEVTRLTNTTTDLPYDSPANIAFDGHGSLLATNHAFATADPTHMTVLKVFVDDKAGRLFKPEFDDQDWKLRIGDLFCDIDWFVPKEIRCRR